MVPAGNLNTINGEIKPTDKLCCYSRWQSHRFRPISKFRGARGVNCLSSSHREKSITTTKTFFSYLPNRRSAVLDMCIAKSKCPNDLVLHLTTIWWCSILFQILLKEYLFFSISRFFSYSTWRNALLDMYVYGEILYSKIFPLYGMMFFFSSLSVSVITETVPLFLYLSFFLQLGATLLYHLVLHLPTIW